MASNSSYLDCPYSSSFKFFDVTLPNLETSIVNLSEFVEHDTVTSKEANNVIKKCKYREKKKDI